MHLDDYLPIVGSSVLEELKILGKKLEGKRVLNVNSTAVGGGVAEILNCLIPLFHDVGIDAQWKVMKGDESFFAITKKIHNALHGAPVVLTDQEIDVYWKTQEANRELIDESYDYIVMHDPQPAGLIREKSRTKAKWVWRCHIDVSTPNLPVWNFLKPTINQYDASIFSSYRFSRQLDIRQVLIAPAIDPLSDKNKELKQDTIDSVLHQFGISKDKPLVTQVSRFDRLKDPAGVIAAYKLVKLNIDCQLLLVGGSATDDPEGAQVLKEIRELADGDPDIHILELPPTSNLEINAFQRASTVVLQKSLKEGFGLTVSEALWKSKPVIAGDVGGIPRQMMHKFSGILTHSIDGTAYWLKQILQSPTYARLLGENGREFVRGNFLVTRNLRDYLLLFLSFADEKEDVLYL